MCGVKIVYYLTYNLNSVSKHSADRKEDNRYNDVYQTIT